MRQHNPMVNKHRNEVFNAAFDTGYKAHKDEMASNYDNWRRSCIAQGVTGQLFDIADLAVRQVIYGNPLGKRPDETDKKETT